MIKNASAYVRAGDLRGTGYLVTKDFVITCAHVVDSIDDLGDVVLRFGEEETIFCATLIKRDEKADCALLKLKTPLINTKPLKLYTGSFRRGDTWEGYGFPSLTKEVGHWLSGDVQDPKGRDTSNSEAIVLYAREVAAGRGAAAQGFSGSPVIIGGVVVGHLKRIIANRHSSTRQVKAEMGTLYATPAKFIVDMLPEDAKVQELPPKPPSGYDPNWYIRREEEENLAKFSLIYPSTPVVLQAPFLFGKTNLLQYLLDELRNDATEPATIATINLQLIPQESKSSIDMLLKEIATQLVLDLFQEQDWVEKTWRRFGGPLSKMADIMEDYILPRTKNRFVLAIDQADMIAEMCIKNDFFSMLRSWVEECKDSWSRFRLIMAISASPTELVDNLRMSPFNISETIQLKDLEEHQVYELLQKFALNWSEEELLILRRAVGGHPYLLRVLMYRAKITKTNLKDLLKDTTKLFDTYLSKYRKWLVANPKMFDELKFFKSGEYTSARDRELCRRMVKAGLLIEDKSLYRLRYELYKELIE